MKAHATKCSFFSNITIGPNQTHPYHDISDGRWGYQDPQNWAEYLKWLDEAGILTTALQSRHPDSGPGLVSLDDLRKSPPPDSPRLVSLDDLRSNDPVTVGEKIPLEDIPQVFTNEFLG